MLPDVAVPAPASLMTLLAVFSPLFTAPSFRTFCGLACGFRAQVASISAAPQPEGTTWRALTTTNARGLLPRLG